MSLSLSEIKRLRTLTLIALFSDDDLMEALVLKGGNALEIGYGLISRGSIDLDFSMIRDFSEFGLNNIDEVESKLQRVLSKTFIDEGYQVFDVRIKIKPRKKNPENEDFWSGYEASFKLIELEKYETYRDNPVSLAAKSVAVDEGRKNMTIDFGRYEYCGDITTTNIEGYVIPIYTPTLIVLEKLRAICQQMSDYLIGIGKEPEFGRPRARDFFDIYTVLESHAVTIDFKDPDTLRHLRECFKAKRVPIRMLSKIVENREFHRQGDTKLYASVMNKKEYKGFDFYFDYVLDVLQENGLHLLEEIA